MDKITKEEFDKLFEKNADGSYKNLVIPAMYGFSSMDLRNKKIEDYTEDEIIVSKKYKMFLKENLKTNEIFQNDETKYYLTLGTKKFDFNEKESILTIYYDPQKDVLTKYNFELYFNEGLYEEDFSTRPIIAINDININTDKIEKLNNTGFSINNVEDSLKRDDTFYCFEFEPFLNYDIKIKEINNDKAHVIISGNAVTTDYSPNSKGESFYADVIVSVVLKSTVEQSVQKHDKIHKITFEKIFNIFLGTVFVLFALVFIFAAIITKMGLDYRVIILSLSGLFIGSILLISNIKK